MASRGKAAAGGKPAAAAGGGGAGGVRLARELRDVTPAQFDVSGVQAVPVVEGVLTHLKGTIKGPMDSPYTGGIFLLDVIIPAEYPFAPPVIKFETKIWHPNISSVTGAICLDILKKGSGSAWTPALTVKTALLSISALLTAPEPTDPQDAVVAGQYLKDKKEWEATARFWTEMHAMPGGSGGAAAAAAGSGTAATGAASSTAAKPAAAPAAAAAKPDPPNVVALVGMGFDRAAVIAALTAKGNNLEAAMEKLLSEA